MSEQAEEKFSGWAAAAGELFFGTHSETQWQYHYLTAGPTKFAITSLLKVIHCPLKFKSPSQFTMNTCWLFSYTVLWWFLQFFSISCWFGCVFLQFVELGLCFINEEFLVRCFSTNKKHGDYTWMKWVNKECSGCAVSAFGILMLRKNEGLLWCYWSLWSLDCRVVRCNGVRQMLKSRNRNSSCI